MKIGLDLVNWKKIPSDSIIHVVGRNIKKVLITVDVSAAEADVGERESLADMLILWSKWAYQNVRRG
jgi:hypothetical protein